MRSRAGSALAWADEGEQGPGAVDPALLAPPERPPRTGWRRNAAVVLDRELVGLAGMHARCRLVQARLARRLLERRAWSRLGFVRLSDYCRERLGIAPRTMEDDARVLRALDSLPVLAGELERGALAWSRVRVLVRVATAENEARLLAASSGAELRCLDDFLRDFVAGNLRETEAGGSPAHNASVARRSADDWSDDDADPEQDPSLRWRVEISRGGRRVWRRACAMASRMSGHPLSTGGALECIAAEAAAAERDEGAEHRAKASPLERGGGPTRQEQALRDRLLQEEARARRALFEFLAEHGVAEGFAWLEPAARLPGPAAEFDLLLDGLRDADAFELDARLRRLRLAAHRIDFQITTLLRVGIERRLFGEIGFASTRHYVESRLGCSARTAWSMLAVERDCRRRSPTLGEAWRDGRVSHLAAATLLRVVSERNARAWIARAGEVTLRRLQDEVAWALDREDGSASGEAVFPPGPEDDVCADGTGDVGLDEVRTCAHGHDAEVPGRGCRGRVGIECRVPLSVAVLVEETIERYRRLGEPRWRAFERMVATALLEWERQPRHPDPVFARDGWRCTVPGCSSRRNLHDHHLLFRSHGGGNARDNRTTVCAAHHLHGIHTGVVRGRGVAPGAILWELGCSPDRPALMRLVGDRYLVTR